MKTKNLLISAAVGVLMATSSLVHAGSIINVAVIGEPDTLDPMISTKDIVTTITQHIFETLYAFDENWQPQPLIAASMPEITDDGKTYRIALREGITFHDGSVLNSADVVDSINRWIKTSSRAKALISIIETVEMDGDNSIVIKLNSPYAPLLSLLAFSNAGAAIFPQEIIGEDGLTETIGSGPYLLAEHKPDQYIRLTAFKDYISPKGETSFAAGARNQTPDEIRFIPVPDASTRLEGVLSGQFQYADSIFTESFDRLNKSKTAEPVLRDNALWPMFAFNHKQGLMANLNLRKAVQFALSEEDMLIAAGGEDRYFQTKAALYPEGHLWHSKSGIEAYNVADAAKAGEYLKAGDYDGTPLRILTSHQYEFHFKMAEVAKFYLEAAGFKVKLDVVDWATLGQKRNNPDEWDIFITHSPFLPDPALVALYSPQNRIGWKNSEKEAMFEKFTRETDITKRKALFDSLQGLVFADVPFIKIGNLSELRGQARGMKGVPESPWMMFWNAQAPK